MARVVVDSSIVVKWFLQEEGSEIARHLDPAQLDAPDLLLAECCNVFWRKAKIGEFTADEAFESASALSSAPISLHPMSGSMAENALRIAVQLDHPVYDCVYLALAVETGLQLLTADQRLFRAASRDEAFEPLVELLA